MQKAKMLMSECIVFDNTESTKMIIKTLEEMEAFVAKNKGFVWDGWTVVKRYQSDKGRTSKHGVCIKGKWYIQQRFEPSEKGWVIPEKTWNNA